MEISVGHPLNQRYLIYYRSARGEFGSSEEEIVKESPERLIVWKDDGEILGHAIWHPSDTETHPDGSQREEDDREILLELLGGPAAFVELHEIWLLEEHRGKGYGKAFFEDMMAEKGFRHIVSMPIIQQLWPSAGAGATGRPTEWSLTAGHSTS